MVMLSACGSEAGSAGGITVTLVTPVDPDATPTLGPGESPTPAVPPELVLSAVEVFQSGAVLVSVTGDVTAGTANFLGRNFKLAKGTQSMFAFVAVDTGDPVGPQPLKVDVTLVNGSKATLQDTVVVVANEWSVDSLEFTEEQTTDLLDPQVVAAELALLRTLYSGVTPEKLWAGGWAMPVDGAITARYGEQRSINGSAPTANTV